MKIFINLRFNFSRPQVTLDEDGGVIITGLYDGIPDDVQNQDHEVFDHILELVGWIEGCIELPICSDSVASQLLEEMPKPTSKIETEVINTTMMDDKEEERNQVSAKDPKDLIARQMFDKMFNPQICLEPKLIVQLPKDVNAISHYEHAPNSSTLILLRGQPDSKILGVSEMTNSLSVVVDELDCWIPKLVIMGEFAFDLGIIYEKEWTSGTEFIDVSGKLKVKLDEINVAREFSNFIAHQVLDEMSKSIFSYKAMFDTPILSRAPSISVIVNLTSPLVLESRQKLVVDSKPIVTDCYDGDFACSASRTTWITRDSIENVMFDPGGGVVVQNLQSTKGW